jgi:hypothetical protein
MINYKLGKIGVLQPPPFQRGLSPQASHPISLQWKLSNMLNGHICVKKRSKKLKGGSWEDRKGEKNIWKWSQGMKFNGLQLNTR